MTLHLHGPARRPPDTFRTRLGWRLWASASVAGLACALSLTAIATPTLDERMQRFQDGSLKGFALSALPDVTGQTTGQTAGRAGSQHPPLPYSDDDFRDLAATGANVVRVPIHLRHCDGCTAWERPDRDIRYVEQVLAQGQRHGFRVVVVLQPVPWGQRSDYWDSEPLQQDMARQWGHIASRLRPHSALQAYDLINEPVGNSRPAQWHALTLRIVHELRRHDPDTPVMVEPSPWGLPGSFRNLLPLDLPGLVYSFHLYAPHAFTHQGLPGYPEAQAYPGQGWDRQRLSQAMDEARRFAARQQRPMFVGEFSCVRWAPAGSCPRYLADAVALFEAERWGWTYHCWRCYQGWDAEVPPDVPQAQRSGRLPELRRADAPALRVLRQAMDHGRSLPRR
jgi:hypothetical protein